MNTSLREEIAALGTELTMPMMQGTQALFAKSCAPIDAQTLVERDLSYGPDDRHRLDIFRREGASGAPVLVYVHGGGFVMGDKRSDTLPFYDNVGDFAARSGMIGVTITYRLAPAHPWPAGPEDMGRVIEWLYDNIADHGGDPSQIYLMGQSAGAVHVASYAAHKQFHGKRGAGIAAALLISCIYDIAAAHANDFHRAYYGADEGAYPAASVTQGLIDTDIPVLATVSEYDIVDFQKQAAAYVADYTAQWERYPNMHWMAGHNHLSPVLQIGSPGSDLEPIITDFIKNHNKSGEQ